MEKTKAPFEEELAGLVYDMFKAAGLPIHQNNLEVVRKVTPRVGTALRDESRRTALELVKRLQEAVVKGFETFGTAVDELKSKVKELEEQNEVLRTKVEALRNRTKELI